jgi:hypothetical protein
MKKMNFGAFVAKKLSVNFINKIKGGYGNGGWTVSGWNGSGGNYTYDMYNTDTGAHMCSVSREAMLALIQSGN